MPYALVGAVVGEFVAASKGLGYLIQYNTSLFSTTGALGGILILAGRGLCNEVLNRRRRVSCVAAARGGRSRTCTDEPEEAMSAPKALQESRSSCPILP